MTDRISIQEFLEEYRAVPVIDVRSPAEYQHGHIPGSINLPLFTDEERASVGKAYHMQGREEAVKEGLKAVGPKMQDFVETALHQAPGRKALVYCWRGGMRSASIAFLLETAGLQVKILNGGYKSYRRYVLDYFKGEFKLVVLGGLTGTGKTDILHELKTIGEQVIDLERLAGHKGSAFGHLGLPEQPSTEQFENLLFEELQNTDLSGRCWVEDESISIGRVNLPKSFFITKQGSPMVNLVMPRELRAERLVKEYLSDIEGLKEAVVVIRKKLGDGRTRKILDALNRRDYFLAAMELLEHYDKTYSYSLNKHRQDMICTLETASPDPVVNAGIILKSGVIYTES